MKIDVKRIRALREQLRATLGIRIGVAIDDEMVSAALALLAEVATLRIVCNPMKKPGIDTVETMGKISVALAATLCAQIEKFMPGVNTYQIFRESTLPR
jgi:hypothetical protein